MRVLIVGSAGREHALAWKAAQSPRLSALFVVPGNAGTESLAGGSAARIRNVALPVDDRPALVAFALREAVDLAIIGPEGPLAAGLADDLRAAGIKVFGPSRAAARIESSKAFAKGFMARHGLPTARHAVFTDFESALSHVRRSDHDVVIKASGLAAGKGVVVPDGLEAAEAALRRIMLAREFGAAGDEVVIEERLSGEEISLLAFTDGATLRPMPPVQDHKRLLDGDRGPNTGGMGACAPTPLCPTSLAEEIVHTVLEPAVDGLRAEGAPFVGVLYAGMMLTSAGPRVLEFNCRFGDPETQALMPLLDSDLLTIAEACAERRLAEIDLRWKPGAAACIVLASAGYPGETRHGRAIHGLETTLEQATFFHAGTARAHGQVATAGGRVLGATGWGATLAEALERAYAAAARVTFEGKQYRTDIGRQVVGANASDATPPERARRTP